MTANTPQKTGGEGNVLPTSGTTTGAPATPNRRETDVNRTVHGNILWTLGEQPSTPGTRSIFDRLEQKYAADFNIYVNETGKREIIKSIVRALQVSNENPDEIDIKKYILIAAIDLAFKELAVESQRNPIYTFTSREQLKQIKVLMQRYVKTGTAKDFEITTTLKAFFKSTETSSELRKNIEAEINRSPAHAGENPYRIEVLADFFADITRIDSVDLLLTLDPMASQQECTEQLYFEWIRKWVVKLSVLPQYFYEFPASCFNELNKNHSHKKKKEIAKQMSAIFEKNRVLFEKLRKDEGETAKSPLAVAGGSDTPVTTITPEIHPVATPPVPPTPADELPSDDDEPDGEELDSTIGVSKDLFSYPEETDTTGEPATGHTVVVPTDVAPAPVEAVERVTPTTPAPLAPAETPVVPIAVEADMFAAPLKDAGLVDETERDAWRDFSASTKVLAETPTDMWGDALEVPAEPTVVDPKNIIPTNTPPPLPVAAQKIKAKPTEIARVKKVEPRKTTAAIVEAETAEFEGPGKDTRKVLKEVYGISTINDFFLRPDEQPQWVHYAFNKLLTTNFGTPVQTKKNVLTALYLLVTQSAHTYASDESIDETQKEQLFNELKDQMYAKVKTDVEDAFESQLAELKNIFTTRVSTVAARIKFRNNLLVGLCSGTETHEWKDSPDERIELSEELTLVNKRANVLPNGSFLIENEGGIIEVKGMPELTAVLNAESMEVFEDACKKLFAAIHSRVKGVDFITNEEHTFTVGKLLKNGQLLIGSLGGKVFIEVNDNDANRGTYRGQSVGNQDGYEFSTRIAPHNSAEKMECFHVLIEPDSHATISDATQRDTILLEISRTDSSNDEPIHSIPTEETEHEPVEEIPDDNIEAEDTPPPTPVKPAEALPAQPIPSATTNTESKVVVTSGREVLDFKTFKDLATPMVRVMDKNVTPADLDRLHDGEPIEPIASQIPELDSGHLEEVQEERTPLPAQTATDKTDSIVAADSQKNLDQSEYTVGPEGKQVGPHFVWSQEHGTQVKSTNGNKTIVVTDKSGETIILEMESQLQDIELLENGIAYKKLFDAEGKQKVMLLDLSFKYEVPKVGDYIVVIVNPIKNDLEKQRRALKMLTPNAFHKLKIAKTTMEQRVEKFISAVKNTVGCSDCFVIRVGDTAMSEGTNETADKKDPLSADRTEADFFSANDDDIARIAEETGFHDEI